MEAAPGSSSPDGGDALYFGVLGPVQLLDGARPVPLGGPGVRGVLAMLLLAPNQVVSIQDIIDGLWGEDVPDTARTIVHGYVSRLRRKIKHTIPGDGDGAEVEIRTRTPGYQLCVDPARIDLFRAERLAEQARDSPPERKAALMRAALALWRGPALADVPQQARVPELEELRVAMVEDRVAADLELGRHHQLVTELRHLARAHPFRERVIGQLMLALYRCGRRAEALEVYQSFSARAREELGLDPGPALRQMHERVLRDDVQDESHAEPAVQAPVVAPRLGVLKPAQLPAATSGFAGRQGDLDWLYELCDSPNRVAVISGVAGVGKSALAITWGHRVSERFPDGQLFASMRGFDPQQSPAEPADVLTQFLLALGVQPGDIPSEVDDRAVLYRSVLAQRQVLVVLDDARDSRQVRPLLAAGPGVFTLITSRVRLAGLVARDDARQLALDTLSRRESVTLLRSLSGVDASDAVREHLAQLCGYLPLALRIVAARLATGQRSSAGELAAELSDESTRLAGLAVEGLDSNVGAALAVSRRNLPPDAARLLTVIGAFAGTTVSAYPVAVISGIGLSATRRALRALVQHSLLTEPAPDMFGVHDLVRLYARELAADRLSAGTRGAMLRATLRYYLAVADAARRQLRDPNDGLELGGLLGPGARPPLESSEQAQQWFEVEWDNLNAVLRAGARAGMHTPVWMLARLAHSFRMVHASRDDWIALLELGMTSARAAGDAFGEAWLLVSKCAVVARFEHSDDTLPEAERALALATAAADDRLLLAAESAVAIAWYARRQQERALAGFRRALELARRLGDRSTEGRQLNNIAQALRELGRLDEAIEAQRAAVARFRGIVDRGFELFGLGNLAELCAKVGDLDAAERHAREAVTVADARGALMQEAFGRLILGQVLRERGELMTARDQFHLAVERYGQVDSTEGAAHAEAELTEVEARLRE